MNGTTLKLMVLGDIGKIFFLIIIKKENTIFLGVGKTSLISRYTLEQFSTEYRYNKYISRYTLEQFSTEYRYNKD